LFLRDINAPMSAPASTTQPTPATRSKAYFSEAEAARHLGVSIDEFRTLVRRHIVDREEDLNNVPITTFHASDLLLLRLLTGRSPTTNGL
jgi:hypothetical protein